MCSGFPATGPGIKARFPLGERRLALNARRAGNGCAGLLEQGHDGWQWSAGFWAPPTVPSFPINPRRPPRWTTGRRRRRLTNRARTCPEHGCQSNRYAWQPGYWQEPRAGYVWMPTRIWTPRLRFAWRILGLPAGRSGPAVRPRRIQPVALDQPRLVVSTELRHRSIGIARFTVRESCVRQLLLRRLLRCPIPQRRLSAVVCLGTSLLRSAVRLLSLGEPRESGLARGVAGRLPRTLRWPLGAAAAHTRAAKHADSEYDNEQQQRAKDGEAAARHGGREPAFDTRLG